MAKRYYKFDENGRPIASYARNQPGVEGLEYLDEPENPNSLRVEGEWVDDVNKHLVQKIGDAEALVNKWIRSSKAVTAVQAQYNVFINGSYNTVGEIDEAYTTFEDWMNITDPTSGLL